MAPIAKKHSHRIDSSMTDDASYAAFLESANKPAKSAISDLETASVEPTLSKQHPCISVLNERLSELSLEDIVFVSETDSDFTATFIPSSSLPSWTANSDGFPFAKDLEGQVDGGWDGHSWSVEDWDYQNHYSAVIKAVKEATQMQTLRVYTIESHVSRFEVFILAKMDDGLVGVKAMGVET